MKTYATAIQNNLAGRLVRRAVCCEATRLDGQVFRFTSIDIDLPIGGHLYRAGGLGFNMTASEAADQLAADNHEVTGALTGAGITLVDILSGKWDSAALHFFQVNYRSISDGIFDESFGTLGNVSTTTLGFTVEYLDFKQRLAQSMLRVVSRNCDANLGDARCKVDLGPFTQTLTVGASPTDRTCVDATRTEADGYWNDGNAVITSSANPDSVGMKMEIKSSDATGHFEFLLPFFFGLLAGDVLSITPGCNKRRKGADGSFTGDCIVKFSNAVNFRGFDAVAGPDAAVSYVQ